MAKGIRVNLLAKELGIESKAIQAKLRAEGLGDAAPNHMSTLPLSLAESVREWFSTASAMEGRAPAIAAGKVAQLPHSDAVAVARSQAVIVNPKPRKQHYAIEDGERGHTFESIVGPYLAGAKGVTVEDPYIRKPHQIQNFVRFCEAVVKFGSVGRIALVTGSESESNRREIEETLAQLQQSLKDVGIILEIKFNNRMHDREIRIDNGWIIKIGRGLDIYQYQPSRYELGAFDLSMRKCRETKVDIYQETESRQER